MARPFGPGYLEPPRKRDGTLLATYEFSQTVTLAGPAKWTDALTRAPGRAGVVASAADPFERDAKANLVLDRLATPSLSVTALNVERRQKVGATEGNASCKQ